MFWLSVALPLTVTLALPIAYLCYRCLFRIFVGMEMDEIIEVLERVAVIAFLTFAIAIFIAIPVSCAIAFVIAPP